MIEINTLTPIEYKRLRVNAGWGDPEERDVSAALDNAVLRCLGENRLFISAISG